ncbi:MAG: aminotransferase class IV, partial [Myxococcota bacterium]
MKFEVVRTPSPRPRPPADNLGFGVHFSDHVFRMDYDGDWRSPRIEPYGPIAMEPGASVLHYAQAIFEGMKAHRGEDGVVRLFRPDRHAARFASSAGKLCMPAVPPEMFVEGCRQLVAVDEDWVPHGRGEALYLRPLLFTDQAYLGVRPADTYRFFIMTSPVGAYYAEGFNPVRILIEKERVRAARGGVGDA